MSKYPHLIGIVDVADVPDAVRGKSNKLTHVVMKATFKSIRGLCMAKGVKKLKKSANPTITGKLCFSVKGVVQLFIFFCISLTCIFRQRPLLTNNSNVQKRMDALKLRLR